MTRGFSIDLHTGLLPISWYPGEPPTSFWSFWKIHMFNRRAVRPIVALRCDQCGALEFAAP
jgi:hypothetical protein